MPAMEPFFAPESWPFAVSLMLLLAITAVEAFALLIGGSVSGWLDHFFHIDAHGLDGEADSWFGWLHLGKVPILVLLVAFLTSFASIGYTINGAALAMLGSYPPVPLSVAIALLGALPVARTAGAAIARIVPRDESVAVPLASLVGRVAVVINGTARMNYPAQARVRNQHGQSHYVHVEPEDENTRFVAGESVLLVQQLSGSRFLAIPNPRPDIL